MLHEIAERLLSSRTSLSIELIPLHKLIHVYRLRGHTCTNLSTKKNPSKVTLFIKYYIFFVIYHHNKKRFGPTQPIFTHTKTIRI
ncbi:hypothetical protein Hanom_Chr08g00746311 [Helianthus anomalus]